MSNNLAIDIENVVNVQLLKEQRGANYDNINHVIMMTSETGAIFNGNRIYATYKNIAGVKADFGITSKTYQMATAFFATSRNPIGSGGIARRLNFDYTMCIKNRSSILHPLSIFLRFA